MLFAAASFTVERNYNCTVNILYKNKIK